MFLSLLQGWKANRAGGVTAAAPDRQAKPFVGVESLEGRVLMAAQPGLGNLGAAGAGKNLNLNAITQALRKADVNVGQLANVSLTNVGTLTQNAAGNVVGAVQGLLRLPGGVTRALDFALTLIPPQQAGACPILNLELNEINLNLLGLQVETSDICLNITATPGGGVLGDLLCGLAGPGGLLGNIAGNLGRIADALEGLLDRLDLNLGLNGFTRQGNQLLANMTLSLAAGRASDSESLALPFAPTADQTAPNECAILNLSLGPVELNLLGLNVELDNCEGGPITVDVTAVRGPGNLLGNLLCGITGALDGGLSLDRLADRLNRLLDRLDRILDRAA